MHSKGDKVILMCDNPTFNGQTATVTEPTEWGAHVSTSAGTGHFRAHHSEMVPYEHLNGRDVAKAEGYTGDVCDKCGSHRMRHSGTCLVCEDCGSSGGCG